MFYIIIRLYHNYQILKKLVSNRVVSRPELLYECRELHVWLDGFSLLLSQATLSTKNQMCLLKTNSALNTKLDQNFTCCEKCSKNYNSIKYGSRKIRFLIKDSFYNCDVLLFATIQKIKMNSICR